MSRYIFSTTIPQPVRRIIPSPTDILHVLKMGERIDNLASKYYNDPTLSWVIMYANPDWDNNVVYDNWGMGIKVGAGSFFLGTANAFFGGLGPLLVIGSSQQTSSATTQSQSSSTTKASPHTSQQSKSPGFTFDMNIPSCVVDGSKLFLSIRETRMSAILV